MTSENRDRYKDFEMIYRDHFETVASTVKNFRLNDAKADDIIQDTFIQAWENLSSLREPKALRAWIITIARNNCLKALNQMNRHRTVSITTTDTSDSDIEPDLILVANDDYASFHFEHSIELLQELINAHEGEPRATIARLFYLEKMPVKSIAAQLDIKQNTILSHLRRFRLIVSKAMMELVEEKGIEI